MSRVPALALALALAWLAGCGGTSRLVIRHDDPTHLRVEVSIDQDVVATLAYGDALYIRLDRGHYVVDIRPEGADANPWSDDGAGWSVYIEDEATLTLLQEAPVP